MWLSSLLLFAVWWAQFRGRVELIGNAEEQIIIDFLQQQLRIWQFATIQTLSHSIFVLTRQHHREELLKTIPTGTHQNVVCLTTNCPNSTMCVYVANESFKIKTKIFCTVKSSLSWKTIKMKQQAKMSLDFIIIISHFILIYCAKKCANII